jgi:protein AroM
MNGVRKVGGITIGQSPRTDMVPEILEILGPQVELIEGGALDSLARAEIERLAPVPGDYVLVTRLRDGSSVHIAEHHILPRMQAQVDRVLAAGAEVVALLCTGEFPPFRSNRLIVKPQVVLNHFVAGVAEGRKLGVLVPAAEQVEQAYLRWGPVGKEARVEGASPYQEMAQTERAAEALHAWGAELIVLDCMGFTKAHKARVVEIAGVPVILPRAVLARTLAELL